MKTNIYFRTVALIAALSCLFGCTNPEIEIRKGVEIQIHPSTILSGFTAFESEHLEMLDDSYLRITCLLYDRNGNLAYQDQARVGDFGQDVTFRTTLDEKNGNYTIIALATCIQGTLSSPTYEAYTISNTQSLNQLRIKQVYSHSFSSTWSIMGYASKSVSFDDAVVRLNMKPATSLVYLLWQDLHAHDNDGASADIYGSYSAKASDYWGKHNYSWTITIEKDGSSSTDVIVKDFSPALYVNGFTSDKGYNTYKGKISGNTLTIAKGQATGYTDSDGSALLYGGEENGEMVTFKDIILRIGNGKLTTTNMFGTCVPGSSGWYELFNPGVVFTKKSSSSEKSSTGIDTYRFYYHSNDIMSFDDYGSPIYSTSLASANYYYAGISPADYTESKNVYSMRNLFPESSMKLFARAYSGNTYTDYSEQTFTLVSGHQYVFSLDCESFKLKPYEGILGTKSSICDFSTYEDRPQASHQLDPIKNN